MEKSQAINDIKSIRVNIDILINTVKFLNPSREVSLAHTNLQRSKMWLGKCLTELGDDPPYPHCENPGNRIIEPQAEHSNDSLLEDNMDQVTNVKMLRGKIRETVDVIKKFDDTVDEAPTQYYFGYFIESLLAIEESKMWLGMELDRIRTEDKP